MCVTSVDNDMSYKGGQQHESRLGGLWLELWVRTMTRVTSVDDDESYECGQWWELQVRTMTWVQVFTMMWVKIGWTTTWVQTHVIVPTADSRHCPHCRLTSLPHCRLASLSPLQTHVIVPTPNAQTHIIVQTLKITLSKHLNTHCCRDTGTHIVVQTLELTSLSKNLKLTSLSTLVTQVVVHAHNSSHCPHS